MSDIEVEYRKNNVGLNKCSKEHFGDNKIVEIVSVAICVRSYHIMTVFNTLIYKCLLVVLYGLDLTTDVFEIDTFLKIYYNDMFIFSPRCWTRRYGKYQKVE